MPTHRCAKGTAENSHSLVLFIPEQQLEVKCHMNKQDAAHGAGILSVVL